MGLSFHEYEGYHADVQATFGELFDSLGLVFDNSRFRCSYQHPKVEIRFGIELQMPEMSLQFPDRQPFSIQELMAAAGDPDDLHIPVPWPSTPSQRATAKLLSWRPFLAKYLPKLMAGDFSEMKVQSCEEHDYAYKLRRTVGNNAPVGHLIFKQLWEPGWQEIAEQFVRDNGLILD